MHMRRWYVEFGGTKASFGRPLGMPWLMCTLQTWWYKDHCTESLNLSFTLEAECCSFLPAIDQFVTNDRCSLSGFFHLGSQDARSGVLHQHCLLFSRFHIKSDHVEML